MAVSSSCSLTPSPPTSAKPAVMIARPLMPRSPQARTTSFTWLVDRYTMATSISASAGMSAREG